MTAHVDDELWDEFHRVVNMTSRELSEWLMTRSAGEDAEVEPDHAGTPTGQQVLAVLGKRRTDLTAEDAHVMRRWSSGCTPSAATTSSRPPGRPRGGTS